MPEAQNSKRYDLEERTFKFARGVRSFVRKLLRTLANIEDSKQLIRSSGSMAANYIEANESLGRKDLGMRIKICRKEAKESGLWLNLLDTGVNTSLEQERQQLLQEATELRKIFGSIVEKLK